MNFKKLNVYSKSFDLAMEIFDATKVYPKYEMYSLVDQIRRSSRSVTTNFAEAYGKRLYPKYFVSKLTDALSESAETEVWLEFSWKCGYLSPSEYQKLSAANSEVGRLLTFMIKHPHRFL